MRRFDVASLTAKRYVMGIFIETKVKRAPDFFLGQRHLLGRFDLELSQCHRAIINTRLKTENLSR
jgi:hypothetical protein